jgi:PAS domain-containing protein
MDTNKENTGGKGGQKTYDEIERIVDERTRELVIENSRLKEEIETRRQAEAALKESEARFRTFVDYAADVFFLQDERGIILDLNRQACKSLGKEVSGDRVAGSCRQTPPRKTNRD